MVEEKKKKEFDDDVLEMAEVFEQLSKLLEKVSTTPDALEAMAVSVLINRREKERWTARQTPTPTPQSAPTNASAGKKLDNEKECPTCHSVLVRRFKEGGSARGYFSCGKCHQYVNEDGSTKAWPNR
jgi:ribosomal protein S27AE